MCLSFPQLKLTAALSDYGCALWKDILTQGRLYISEHHLCFYANILGWVTNVGFPGLFFHAFSCLLTN